MSSLFYVCLQDHQQESTRKEDFTVIDWDDPTNVIVPVSSIDLRTFEPMVSSPLPAVFVLCCTAVFGAFLMPQSHGFSPHVGALTVPLASILTPAFKSESKSVLRMSDPKDDSEDDVVVEQVDTIAVVKKKDETSEKWREMEFMSDSSKVNAALGLGRGAVLLTIVLLINVWFFTIPVEFRRTRLCSEMDTAAYPERCMTTSQFTQGISDYYSDGKEQWTCKHWIERVSMLCFDRQSFPGTASHRFISSDVGGGIKFDFSLEDKVK